MITYLQDKIPFGPHEWRLMFVNILDKIQIAANLYLKRLTIMSF